MTETTDSIRVVESLPPEAPNLPSRRPRAATVVAVLFMFGLGVALTTINLPYFVLEPGQTLETESALDVDGVEFFESPGEVRFVTVSQRRVSVVDYLISAASDSDELIHEDDLLRGRSVDEQREQNAQLMISSQNEAVAAALTELGFDVSEPAGVVLIDVVEGSDLDGRAELNDVIRSVNGRELTTIDDLSSVVDELADGEEALVDIRRPDGTIDTVPVTVTSDTAAFLGIVSSPSTPETGTGAAFDDVLPGGPVDGILEPGDVIVGLGDSEVDGFGDLIGALSGLRSGDRVPITFVRPGDSGDVLMTEEVVLGSRVFERIGIARAATQFRDAELPLSIGFKTDDIGGPSAGLAFTLTILDVLTPGDLTGGAKIVATGTIGRDGTVGAIGGVHQKAFAAREEGADVFIVPAENFDEARAALDDLRIEPVQTLDDALAVLAELGGNVDELPDEGRL